MSTEGAVMYKPGAAWERDEGRECWECDENAGNAGNRAETGNVRGTNGERPRVEKAFFIRTRA